MVCWLRFLKKVSDMLGEEEPNVYRRKQLAITILKELETEKGHDVDAIGRAIDEEGAEGIRLRARKSKRDKKKEKRHTEEVETEIIRT